MPPSLLDFNRFSVYLQPLGLLCCGRACWVRNHEHIALLGLCLSSPSAEAHKIARHLADYVLVWAGGGGKDDVGKSKHMARIANSVYDGHCNEEDCDLYGIFPDGKPSKMMETSLMLDSLELPRVLPGIWKQQVEFLSNCLIFIYLYILAIIIGSTWGSTTFAAEPLWIHGTSAKSLSAATGACASHRSWRPPVNRGLGPKNCLRAGAVAMHQGVGSLGVWNFMHFDIFERRLLVGISGLRKKNWSIELINLNGGIFCEWWGAAWCWCATRTCLPLGIYTKFRQV